MNALIPLREPTPDLAFAQLFNRLAVALRLHEPDAAMLAVYHEALKDLPVRAVEGGATALMKEPGRRFFPTTGEWRQAAEAAQEQLWREAVKPAREEPWKLECEACEDTGWERFHCPGDESCGRRKTHREHDYVRVCTCRPNNRTYVRNQKFGGGAA